MVLARFSVASGEYIDIVVIILVKGARILSSRDWIGNGRSCARSGNAGRHRLIAETTSDRARRARLLATALNCLARATRGALSPRAPTIWRTWIDASRIKPLASSAYWTFTTTSELNVTFSQSWSYCGKGGKSPFDHDIADTR